MPVGFKSAGIFVCLFLAHRIGSFIKNTDKYCSYFRKFRAERNFHMENQLVKLKGMEVMEVDFNGDNLIVVKRKEDEKLYVGVNFICNALGLNERKQRDRIQEHVVLSKGCTTLYLPTKGGNQKALCMELDYLPLWLATVNIKLVKPEVVDKLTEYQLKAKDVLAHAFLGKQKDWNIQREVGKIDRKRMTSSIHTYIPDAKFYTYAGYTDMVYKILFGITAKQIREIRNINKKSDLTRDYLTEDELKLVDEAETIVTALTALGFRYDYIKHQLENKYNNVKMIV